MFYKIVMLPAFAMPLSLFKHPPAAAGSPARISPQDLKTHRRDAFSVLFHGVTGSSRQHGDSCAPIVHLDFGKVFGTSLLMGRSGPMRRPA